MPKTKTKPTGRPSEYTQEKADEMCALFSQGKSLKRICDEDETMPLPSTFFRWIRENEDFGNNYARAKRESSEAMAEEIMDISDDGTNDWMEDQYMKGKSPGWKVNGEAVQRSKLRVETRKWLMSKLVPKKYGDKVDVTSDGKAIQGNSIVFTDFAKPDEAESKPEV